MKTSTTFCTIGAALIAAVTTLPVPVFAACPANQSAEERMYCITVEGAGHNYEQYITQRAAEIRATPASNDIAELRKHRNIEVERATQGEATATTH